jgi:hypothetical protein
VGVQRGRVRGRGAKWPPNPAAGGTATQPPAPAAVPPMPQNNISPPGPPQVAQAPLGSGGATALPGGPPGAPAAPQAASAGAPAGNPAVPHIAAALGGGGAATPATPFPVSSRTAPAPITRTGTPATRVTALRSYRRCSLLRLVPKATARTSTAARLLPAPRARSTLCRLCLLRRVSRGSVFAPAKDDSPAEYNRVGTELLGKLTEKYGGDPAKAWAAYNCGTGRVDHALLSMATHGWRTCRTKHKITWRRTAPRSVLARRKVPAAVRCGHERRAHDGAA